MKYVALALLAMAMVAGPADAQILGTNSERLSEMDKSTVWLAKHIADLEAIDPEAAAPHQAKLDTLVQLKEELHKEREMHGEAFFNRLDIGDALFNSNLVVVRLRLAVLKDLKKARGL